MTWLNRNTCWNSYNFIRVTATRLSGEIFISVNLIVALPLLGLNRHVKGKATAKEQLIFFYEATET